MAKRRCKKGVVKSGPRKGLCRKVARPSTARKSHKKRAPARKARGHRPNCEKFGFSVLLGRCRKGPVRSHAGKVYKDDSVRQAMQASMRRGQYNVTSDADRMRAAMASQGGVFAGLGRWR
jgi:hypothetical protein